MTEDKKSTDAPEAGLASETETATVPAGDKMPLTIHAQYIKDLSFENPNAPKSLRGAPGNPVMEVSFAMDAKKLDVKDEAHLYEVVLGVNVKATRSDDMVAFIGELAYGITVSVEGVSENAHHPLLLIDVPRYAFPFVRQIMANMTQQAGYMPLLLSPVDFKGLYARRFGQQGAPDPKNEAENDKKDDEAA